jgi:hypothetical protein
MFLYFFFVTVLSFFLSLLKPERDVRDELSKKGELLESSTWHVKGNTDYKGMCIHHGKCIHHWGSAYTTGEVHTPWGSRRSA